MKDKEWNAYLSRRKHFRWKPYIALASIYCRTHIKSTTNFTLCYTVGRLSNYVNNVKNSSIFLFLNMIISRGKINNTKVMKQSSNNCSCHSCRWSQSSLCNFRFAIFPTWFFCIKGDWTERWKGSQRFRCKRKSTCFNLQIEELKD